MAATPAPIPIALEETLLSVEDICHLVNARPSFVYSAVERKALPYIRLGKFLRFRQSDVRQWLTDNENRSKQVPDAPPRPPKLRLAAKKKGPAKKGTKKT